MRRPRRFVPVVERLRRDHPELADPEAALREGRVRVAGRPILSPEARVPAAAAVTVQGAGELRGAVKLRAALTSFSVPVSGRVALDLGAATGGFTTALLEAGAATVHAVDAGRGLLLGSLRRDPRVRSHEGVNIANLGRDLVPDAIGVVTVDLSYLALARAIPHIEQLAVSSEAHLIGLVKPMFELALARPPDDPATLWQAAAAAVAGVDAGHWSVAGLVGSPVRGRRGTVEFLLHARRAPPTTRPAR